MGPVMPAWLLADIQEPDTYARPEMITKAGAAAVQNLCGLSAASSRRTPSSCRASPP